MSGAHGTYGMEPSPKGRLIIELDGTPGDIVTRGTQIQELGDKMISSATALENLASGQSEQRGKAIEKVREIVGDTYTTLRAAGELYQPVGPVLIAYGQALDTVQPRVKSAVEAARESWALYAADPGGGGVDSPGLFASGAEKEQYSEDLAAAKLAKQRLYDDFLSDAGAFDAAYDTWEDAFDSAVNGFTDAFDGAIEDGFWDNVDGYVGVVLKVLEIAGILLAIAGLIIGGPLIGLIAAVVGVVALALTAYRYFRKDAGLADLGFAVLSVLPFGKVGKLFQGRAGAAEFGLEMTTAFRPSAWSSATTQGTQLTRSFLGGYAAAGEGVSGAAGGLRSLYRTANPSGFGDVLTRFFLGKDVTAMTKSVDAFVDLNGKGTRVAEAAAFWELVYPIVTMPTRVMGQVEMTPFVDDEEKVMTKYPWLGVW